MIKNLMIEKNSYIVEYKITENLHLFFEGLNKGQTIYGGFDINKVDTLLVELHDKDGLLYTFNFNNFYINDKLTDLKDIALENIVYNELEKEF